MRVILDGIYLQASPVDVTKLSPEECNEIVQLAKRNKLREIEESIIASIESKKGGFADKAMKAGYIQQMTTKIVDNIEITLTNLHIRYEDQFSIPGSVFSAGITIDSLTLAAADENWVSAFITRAREAKSGTAETTTAAAVRKLGTLDNLCIYWNAESNTLDEFTYDVWENTMFSLIYATKDTETTSTSPLSDTLYYILSPPNNLTVKIIENSKPSDVIPKIEVTFESSTIPLQFDKLHYEQILGITGVFVQMQSNLQMGLYRPSRRPAVDPRAWWKYAYKLVTGKDPSVTKRTETMLKCMRQRSKYMTLVKTRRLNIDAGKQVPLSASQAEELQKIEEELPLTALLEFHQLAIRDAKCESIASPQKSTGRLSVKLTKGNSSSTAHSPATKSSSSTAASKQASKSIFSYFSFGKSDSKDVEDEELLRKLEEKFSLNKSIDDEMQLFSFRINIITSLALNLQYDYLPVVSLEMSLRSRLEMKVNNFSMSFELNNFSVKDTCTPQPFNEYIISMWDHSTIPRRRSVGRLKHVATSYDSNAIPQLIISFESKPGKEVLMISALPLQISWNEKCLVKLIGLWIDRSDIIPEKSITADVVSLSNMDRRMIASIKDKFASEAAVSYEGMLELFVEVEAPIIIIPENSQIDSGYLLLDSGYLTIQAAFDHTGMDWDIQLKDINIGMPNCFADYTTTLENETYLVKPFTIKFGFDNRKQDVYDLGISASASPSLTANFDAKKIIRLMAVINVIINSFDFNSVNSMRLVKKRRDSVSCNGTPVQKNGDKQSSKKFTYAANAPKPFSLDTQSLNRISVQATVTIPLVSVTLAIAENHVIELSLHAIDCIILQRLQDINARVSSTGLSLKDSLRPTDDQEVIWTPTENETEISNMISFSYRVMYSTISPLYDGFEQEISLLLPKLCVSIDDETIIKLSPFVRNVLMFYNDYIEKQPAPAEAQETISLVRASSPPPTSLGGVHITLSIDGICVYLLSPLASSSSAALNESYNESAFCLSVDKIYADLHLGELTKIDTYLTSFSINDTRKASQKYFYRTLICKSSEYINLNYFDVAEPEAGMDVDTAHSISEAINAGVQKLLYVSFNQNSPSETIVDVCIRDITSVIAVDILLDLVNLVMKIVKAVNDLMAEISSDASKKEATSAKKGEKLRKLMRRSFSMHPQDLNNSGISDGEHSVEVGTPSEVPPSTVNVNVKLINPLLLLLENPEISSSKAIVSRCKFSFHYKYNMMDCARNESKEVMHGSLRGAEIFVLTDMMKIGATPHQIIEPTIIDFHYKHTTENNENNTGITLTSDAIHCRVSLNDVVLATSIINRASLVRSVTDSGHDIIEADERALDSNFQREGKGDSVHPGPSVKPQASSKSSIATVFDVKLSLGKIHLVLVNDVSGQNVPILRAIFDGTEFIASGTLAAISGDGSLFLAADYFNTSIGSWEPLVEQWHPLIKISKEMKYIKVEVWNDYTLQINLSGMFFKCLYNTLSLISQIGKEGSYVNRNQLNPLTIANHLGIPIELVDGNTKKSVMVLDSNILSPIPSLNATNSGSSAGKKLASKNSKLFPSEFEIHLLGPMKDLMFPIIHLPLTCSKPRLYSFHPLNELVSRAVTYGEPIVEDAYENSRYYPLQARWGAPWTHMGDPQEWSDGRGKGSRELTSIKLPMNWEWVEPSWKVDMTGEIGRNIDSDGWEYSINFNSFSLTNARRTKQPMDSVRRRRWIRRRVPKNTSQESDSNGVLRPLNIIWDVKMQPDGSREIQLRSQHQFKNEMSFAMEIEASTTNSPTSTVIKFLVPEKSQFNIPLTQKEWKYIRVRPANFPYNSSAYVNCKIFESNIQIQCEGTDLHDLYMIVNVVQEQKSVLISCCPQAILVNYLPVDISYRLLNTQLESGILRAGSRVDIAHVDFRRPVSTTIDIGSFTCKNPIVLSSSKNVNDDIVELVSLNDDQVLPVTLNATLTPVGYMELIVYCRYAVVDRSESRIILQSKRSRTSSNLLIHREVIERRTYRRLWAGSQQQQQQQQQQQRTQNSTSNNNSIQDCWIHGFHGLSIFHAFDNKVSIGVNEGSAWQQDVSLISLGPSKTPIAITDRQTSSMYNLAVSLKPMEGVFSGTQLLTIMPNFEIVNCMEENIYLLQCGDDTFTYSADCAESVSVKSRSAVGLSKLNSHKSTTMRLRCESSAWSIGTVDINEIGTTLLILPRSAVESNYGSNLIIAHVEVKFSDPSDNSYMRIIIWHSSFYSMSPKNELAPKTKKKAKQAVALSIKNDTELPLIVYQVGIDHMLKSLGVNKMLFDLNVPPGTWLPYGWTDQSISSILAICVGTSSHDLLGSTAHVDILQIGQMIELDTSQIQKLYDIGPVFLVIKTFRGGKVVHIFSRRNDSDVDPKFLADGNVNDESAASASTELLLQCYFNSIGLSIIAERPSRRELFSLYVEKVEVSFQQMLDYETRSPSTLFQFLVKDIQIDNYSESALYPVLLNSFNSVEKRRHAKHKSGLDDPPFFSFSIVIITPAGQKTPVVKLCVVRVLEIKLSIDSATILIYFNDLHDDLFIDSYHEMVHDHRSSELFIKRFNDELLSSVTEERSVDIDAIYESAQTTKIYFESVILHPVKITLTFAPVNFSRQFAFESSIMSKYPWISIIQNMAAVDEFEIKIKSFIVKNAMESLDSLGSRVLSKVVRDLQLHLVLIAGSLFGSLSFLGKPGAHYLLVFISFVKVVRDVLSLVSPLLRSWTSEEHRGRRAGFLL